MIYEQKPSKTSVISGKESIVIRKCLHDIQGGRTLDFEGFAEDKIYVGHVIIKTTDGNYAPMPVTAATTNESGETTPGAYAALPAGASYVGVSKFDVLKSNPCASIMTMGVVNETLVPYPMTDIMTAFKAACPFIEFEQDEEA